LTAFQNVTFVPMGFPLSSMPLNTGGIVDALCDFELCRRN
jgi:hypothetical protein